MNTNNTIRFRFVVVVGAAIAVGAIGGVRHAAQPGSDAAEWSPCEWQEVDSVFEVEKFAELARRDIGWD